MHKLFMRLFRRKAGTLADSTASKKTVGYIRVTPGGGLIVDPAKIAPLLKADGNMDRLWDRLRSGPIVIGGVQKRADVPSDAA